MLSAANKAEAADWVTAGVRNFDGTVGSIVPAGFGAYARVFHPASRRMGTGEVEVRWAEVAAANACVMHPAAEWGSLVGSWEAREQPDLWDQSPRTGELPEAPATRLAAVLAKHTTSLECSYFALWDGVDTLGLMFSFSEGTPEDVQRRKRKAAEEEVTAWRELVQSGAAFTLPNREMRLLRGPLAAIEELYAFYRHPPNLWWPEDRAWCVGTDAYEHLRRREQRIHRRGARRRRARVPSGLRRPVRHLELGRGQSAAHATMRIGTQSTRAGAFGEAPPGSGRFMPRDPGGFSALWMARPRGNQDRAIAVSPPGVLGGVGVSSSVGGVSGEPRRV